MRKFLISAAPRHRDDRRRRAGLRPGGAPAGQRPTAANNNPGQVRRLEARVDQIRRQIERLDRRSIISSRGARRLAEEARDLDRRINMLANGFNNRDRYERRLARLEQRRARRQRWPQRHGNGACGVDRDRDGRDDRYEDDGGRYPG